MRRPLITIGLFAIAGIAAAVFGTPVAAHLTTAIGNPRAESARALTLVAKQAGYVPDQSVALVVDVPAGASAPSSQRVIAEVSRRLATVPGIATVVPPTSPSAVSKDGKQVLVVGLRKAGTSTDDVGTAAVAAFRGRSDVLVGGSSVVVHDLNETIARDLGRAELMVFPLLVVLCIWIFRGVVASLITVGIGGLVILLAMLALRALVEFSDVSTYVMNLAIGLGLGLSIDYCLLFISRYREELRRDPASALRVARRRAGRTIWFSAATVAMSMATLLLFPQTFLRSMGMGGVSVTLLAALAATTLLPATLELLGPRLEWGTPGFLRNRLERESRADSHGWWYRLAHSQMRRPVAALLLCLVAVGVLASPLRSIAFGNTDASTLPESSSARQVDTVLRHDFPHGSGGSLFVVARAPRTAGSESVADLRSTTAAMPRVAEASAPAYLGGNLWLMQVTTTTGPYARQTREVVAKIRALSWSAPLTVGGPAAEFADLLGDVQTRLPWALGLAALVVMAVMFALTGSLLLPLKQILINGVTVASTLGVLTWVFQQGHLQGLLGFTSNGMVDLLQPILVIIIAFGLSTDYGVIILARIREAHLATGDNVESVAVGMGRTGRIVTSSAILLVVAIGAFSTSGITFIKTLGVGTALAVGLDAFFVRPFVVPAAMKLLGDLNWWAPAPLARLHRRLLGEKADPAQPAAGSAMMAATSRASSGASRHSGR